MSRDPNCNCGASGGDGVILTATNPDVGAFTFGYAAAVVLTVLGVALYLYVCCVGYAYAVRTIRRWRDRPTVPAQRQDVRL